MENFPQKFQEMSQVENPESFGNFFSFCFPVFQSLMLRYVEYQFSEIFEWRHSRWKFLFLATRIFCCLRSESVFSEDINCAGVLCETVAAYEKQQVPDSQQTFASITGEERDASHIGHKWQRRFLVLHTTILQTTIHRRQRKAQTQAHTVKLSARNTIFSR